MKKIINRIPVWIFIALFLLDTAYSFYQHYHVPIDGDLSKIVLPVKGYSHVMSDPFGLNALLNGNTYPAPNRYFAHASIMAYFKNVPLFLQKFVTPITSIYLSCAIAKTALQVFLIWLIAVYATGVKKINRKEFWWAVVLIFPLFQTCGYNILMGVVDKSITYTFFYAFPLCLLMLFFLPFYEKAWSGKKLELNVLQKILLALLAVILAFNGPLVPGVVLIVCPAVLLYFFRKEFVSIGQSSFVEKIWKAIKQMPRQYLFYFSLLILLCGYSLFIGRYNSEGLGESIPLLERYMKMPIGLSLQYKQKLAFPLLTIFILINAFLIKKNAHSEEGRKVLFVLKMLALFSLIYLLLLPLGGSREYRQYVVRRDTMLPITLGMIYWFVLSAYYLIRNISLNHKWKYIAALAVFSIIYIVADEPNFDANDCERNALHQLASSKERVVQLGNDCTVATWEKITKPENSKIYTSMLRYWNVIEEEKLFFQK